MAKKDSKVTPIVMTIGSLLHAPLNAPKADRKVWGIPLTGVLVPFLTASNATGESAIAAESLGCPLRLAREADGTPKFTDKGRPVVRVVKDITDQVRFMRDNFTSGLMAYTDTVRKGMPEEYKAQVEANRKAGAPVAQKDANDLEDYIIALSAKAEGGNGTGAVPDTDKVAVPA